MRDVILGLDDACRFRQRTVDVADISSHAAGSVHRRAQRFAISIRIVVAFFPASHSISRAARPRMAAQVFSASTAIPPQGLYP